MTNHTNLVLPLEPSWTGIGNYLPPTTDGATGMALGGCQITVTL